MYPAWGPFFPEISFEMTAYTLRDGRRRIAWSETKRSIRPEPTLHTRNFIGALKKARGEKS
jgi:hypothetical protein